VSDDDRDDQPGDEPVALPLDGVLDLHTFRPAEVEAATRDYLEACREVGVLAVRIVHGKGKGVQRRVVRSLLARLPWVRRVRDGDLGGGGWGATLVDLEPPAGPAPRPGGGA
jgi:DNA-nicking Smr family endonuclease